MREAEDGQLFGTMAAFDDAKASDGAFVQAPDGSGNHWSVPSATDPNRAEYCFDLDAPALFTLRGEVGATTFHDDSFWVSVAGETHLWDLRRSESGFVVDDLSDRLPRSFNFKKDPVLFALPAGRSVVTVFPREDGAKLDRFELVPACPPVGTVIEAEDGLLAGNMQAQRAGFGIDAVVIEVPGGPDTVYSTPVPLGVSFGLFCVTVDESTAGPLQLQAQARGLSDWEDSFFVTVGDDVFLWDVQRSSDSIVRDMLNDRFTGSDPVTLDLSPGRHTIKVEFREVGTQLDSFVLVRPKS